MIQPRRRTQHPFAFGSIGWRPLDVAQIMMKTIILLILCCAICSCASSTSRNSQKLRHATQSNIDTRGSCTNLVVDIDEQGTVSIEGVRVSKRKVVRMLSKLGSAEEPADLLITVRRASPHDSVMAVYNAVRDVTRRVVFQPSRPDEWQSSLPNDHEAATNLIDEELFIHGVRNWSTAPNYVLATISTPGIPEGKRMCLEGPQLIGALSFEQGLPPDDYYAMWFSTMIVTSNKSRCFRFTKPEAVKWVNRFWSEKVSKETAALLGGLDRETLLRLTRDRRSWLHQIYRDRDDLQSGMTYGAAIADVLLQNQIPCLRGCERFGLFIDEEFTRKLDTRKSDTANGAQQGGVPDAGMRR